MEWADTTTGVLDSAVASRGAGGESTIGRPDDQHGAVMRVAFRCQSARPALLLHVHRVSSRQSPLRPNQCPTCHCMKVTASPFR